MEKETQLNSGSSSPASAGSDFHWRDTHGNKLTDDEVVHVDIDTMGPQYMGVVTKESFDATNCIDEFVRVEWIGHDLGHRYHEMVNALPHQHRER